MTLIRVKLVCHHYADSLATGDELWTTPVYCAICGAMRQVKTVVEWARVKCLSCRHWKRVAGVDKATKAMYKHSREHPTHIVQCWQGSKLVARTTLARVQPELPLFQLPPPF